MEKEIKKINTYIEMLEVAQQHFEAKGDTKNAEFCTIKINNAKDDIAALQAGYEVDMTEYNSLVSDVEEDVIENIEEPVYDEVNPKYEIITLEEANKKTTNKGKKIIASVGCAALLALIVAGMINMSGCTKKNTKEDNTNEPQTTDEEINEVAKVEETENVVLPVFEEVDLDALISEANENITTGDIYFEDNELVRYLEVINYDVHENEKDVTYEETDEIMNKLRDAMLNKSINKINKLNGIDGTFGYDTGNLLLSSLVLNDQNTKEQLLYLEDLYNDMMSDDLEKNKEALIKYLVFFGEITGEVDNYSVDSLTFDGEAITVDHSVEYNSMNSANKGLVTTQITAMYPLASVIENKLFNDATLDRSVTILGDSEDLEGGNTENQITIQHISADSLMKDFNEMVCSDEISTDDENEYPINEYSNIIIGWKSEVNNSKKEAIYVNSLSK